MGSSSVELTEAMRAKWAQRLSIRVDRSDSGGVLPLTGAALSLGRGKECLEALASALMSERVIVPINVERHPDEDGEHHHIDPSSDDAPLFAQTLALELPAIACYSSVEALHADQPGARPMPLKFRKVALTALAQTRGRVVLDPATSCVVLPRPLVAALAQGDSWLPFWKDAELVEELEAIVCSHNDSRLCGVSVDSDTDGVVTQIVLSVEASRLGVDERVWLMEVVDSLRRATRLGPASDTVQIVPVPVQ